MSQNRQHFLVGLITVVSLAGVVYLLARFGELRRIFQESYAITVFTDDATGLRPGGEVSLNGVHVGQVGEVTLDGEGRYMVRVTAMIDAQHRVPEGSRFQIEQSLLGGSAALLIITPRGEDGAPPAAPGFLPTDGRGRLEGESVSTFEQMFGQVDERLRPLGDALDAFIELSRTFQGLGDELRDLLAEQRPEELGEGAQANLRTAIASANSLIAELRRATADVQELVSDPVLRGNVQDTFAKASTLMDSATAASQRVETLAGRVDQEVERLVAELPPLAERLASAAGEMERLVRLGTEGQGTVALLLNNPDLYLSLDQTAQDLRQTLLEARLLIQKIQSEGVPFRF